MIISLADLDKVAVELTLAGVLGLNIYNISTLLATEMPVRVGPGVEKGPVSIGSQSLDFAQPFQYLQHDNQ
jgi:hypothetical protein